MLTLLNAYNYESGIPPRKLVCLHLSASPVELKQHKMVKLDLSLLLLSRDPRQFFSPKYGKLAISKASKKTFPLKKHILCEFIYGLLFSQRYLPIS